jgi:hypothetical protein
MQGAPGVVLLPAKGLGVHCLGAGLQRRCLSPQPEIQMPRENQEPRGKLKFRMFILKLSNTMQRLQPYCKNPGKMNVILTESWQICSKLV